MFFFLYTVAFLGEVAWEVHHHQPPKSPWLTVKFGGGGREELVGLYWINM